MHDVAVRPIVIVVGAVEVNASVELDARGISRITLRDYWIITAGREHDEHCMQGENRGRGESAFATHREIFLRKPLTTKRTGRRRCAPSCRYPRYSTTGRWSEPRTLQTGS